MKKIVSVFLIALLVLSFSACSKADGAAEDITNYPQEAQGKEKMLIVYFCADNTADADLESGATPYFEGQGATAYLAQHIAQKTGADIDKITPVADYPSDYDTLSDIVKEEQNSSARPEFKPLSHNPEDYDVIIVGYPIWWYKMPNIVESFFDAYDLSGKVIVPFNTCGGSGDAGTYDDIRELEPEATVAQGFNVKGALVGEAEQELDEWLDIMELD